DHPSSSGDIWWGNVNIKLAESSFLALRDQAITFLNGCERLYGIDGFAGWDPRRRLKIRVISARPYHALFMHNMLIRPTAAELGDFGEAHYILYNGREFAANVLPCH